MYICFFLVFRYLKVELDILFHATCFSAMLQCVYKVTEFRKWLHTYLKKINLEGKKGYYIKQLYLFCYIPQLNTAMPLKCLTGQCKIDHFTSSAAWGKHFFIQLSGQPSYQLTDRTNNKAVGRKHYTLLITYKGLISVNCHKCTL